ncbi:chorismate synthase [Carboxydocella sporoproducens DSM 16521]|uniref:Chorismate synthase n=2 Tax=Carboxydocella TaxID=178898 RepID=A0A1T4R9Q0_9FIRM|nr:MULTISPECIES: chorismate synthase [Carboxydocella]AVX19433.1 chorismate synthase [Carboxydocella thermautotrophica]AVX29851.1 chorismate synthase [Carboxydocella thermautotrophica]GAW29084.1 chorismate synthase [Carboxydocella sp. ULO1]SKA12800.1 chorismate synthase [Carboxydocella sporoproducens DSM 16521]
MRRLRFLTAGESHGPALTVIIEGMPAGVPLTKAEIDEQLWRRQQGYGRGGRMAIEKDEVEILSGIRHGLTLGSPISLLIRNRDWENWQEIMSPHPRTEGTGTEKKVTRARPGHADLSGGIKYKHGDLRNILERASARETAARVAAGAVARALLRAAGIELVGQVTAIGGVTADTSDLTWEEIACRIPRSPVFCADEKASRKMMAAIDEARAAGDSLGGVVEVAALGVPVGLGSHVHWDRRLDGRLAQAVMSIQAIKGVEIGMGFLAAARPGSEVHDEIFWEEGRGYYRETNRAGGIEGGISNGEPIIVRAAMKPIPTLYRPLRSVDIETNQPYLASIERSDICAVPAALVVVEAMVALVLADAILERYGGDNWQDLKVALGR